MQRQPFTVSEVKADHTFRPLESATQALFGELVSTPFCGTIEFFNRSIYIVVEDT